MAPPSRARAAGVGYRDVVESILEDRAGLELGGAERDVTVLFADIERYSTLSEQLAPAEVIGLLNRYLSAVTPAIFTQRGMINEIEGDGILAVFGAPVGQPDHAARAVRCTLAMHAAVAALNERWEADGTLARFAATGVDALRIRIGLHSGPVVAGNIGTAERTKYAVIGDTVNTAARVETLNKVLDTRSLLTQAVLDQLPNELRARTAARGEHAVKGRQGSLKVYTLVL